jgi:hypothetical protein
MANAHKLPNTLIDQLFDGKTKSLIYACLHDSGGRIVGKGFTEGENRLYIILAIDDQAVNLARLLNDNMQVFGDGMHSVTSEEGRRLLQGDTDDPTKG